MDNYSKLVVKGRNELVNIFCKKILLLEKNNQIISNKILITFSKYFYHFNLKHLLKINKINIIYKVDDIIFYDEHNSDYKLSINSVIFGAKIDDKDFTDKIKQYSLSIPIFIIVRLENINLLSVIKFNLLKKGCITLKEYIVEDIIKKRLYEII
jgi:hypothetical protein